MCARQSEIACRDTMYVKDTLNCQAAHSNCLKVKVYLEVSMLGDNAWQLGMSSMAWNGKVLMQIGEGRYPTLSA